MRQKQPGFSMVEVIIVLFVIILVGATGWYVLSKRDKKESPSADTAITSNSSLETAARQNPRTLKRFGGTLNKQHIEFGIY